MKQGLKSLKNEYAKPVRRRATVSESTIVSAILRALQLKGVWAWRNNSGLTVLPGQSKSGRRVIKGAPAGSPDILLVIPHRFTHTRPVTIDGHEHGRIEPPRLLAPLCGIEVKSATGKQSETQLAWQAKAESFGVRYGIARSVSDALKLVDGWSGKP